ncbi:ADP-ribosylglycohydrolase family protein [Archangium sp. Cb G35]|uniref:ADP-ribosylglycohydrolase family protein n=1 Tax=Archangium sp. Cb G35 TaxID=1920190 RepID=UPI0009F9F3C5|nr:ADP-ribosylglycohydrolase family protein [Archangium sp. Cb G35]
MRSISIENPGGTMEDRAQGALWGLAWGDALGCPVETWRASFIRQVFGEYVDLPSEQPLQALAGDTKRLSRLRPLGLHSDDTQQGLALVACALEPGGWSRASWARWLVQGMRRKAWRGYGRNFKTAVQQLAKGGAPEHSGSASAGMGAAMRVAPVGALLRDSPGELARVVMESSMMTHADLRASALAYAVAWSVAALVRGEAVDRVRAGVAPAVREEEARWLQMGEKWTFDQTGGHLVSETLAALLEGPLLPPEALRERISALARPHLAEGFTVAHPNQGFALLGGAHGLVRALTATEAPGSVLADIIQQGYDTDTVAAIAGGVLGARFGSGWVPRARLLDAERLELYARALVTRSALPETLDVFVQKEAAWTAEEERFQAGLVRH